MAYVFQTFVAFNVLTATQANTLEVNVRDHVHGAASVSVVGLTGGGTGQITAQLAINALSAVSSATNEYVLKKDTASGNAVFGVMATAGGGSGQVTAQAAINALSAVSAATIGHVLTKSGGNAAWAASAADGWDVVTGTATGGTPFTTSPQQQFTHAITGDIAANDILIFIIVSNMTQSAGDGTLTVTFAKSSGTGALNATGTEVFKKFMTNNKALRNSYMIIATVQTPGTFVYKVTTVLSAGASSVEDFYGTYIKLTPP